MIFQRPRVRCCALAMALVLWAIGCSSGASEPDATARASAASPAPSVPIYICPMHSQIVRHEPGQCPICGMDLVLQKPSAAPAAAGVPDMAALHLSPDAILLAGVQTAEVKKDRLVRTVRAVGHVVPDETRIRHVHTKVSGWIEKLYVNFAGQPVKAGEPILTIYSQALLVAQEELLRARASGGEDLLRAARRRLELLDVPPSFIAQVEKSGKAERAVQLMAPVSGFVTVKGAFEGQQVEPGSELFVITDLSHVWVEADVYEYEATAVRVGMPIVVTLPYDPAFRVDGKVAYIYPTLNIETRTLRVRVDLDNRGVALKPSMYVDVVFEAQLGEGLIVPASAILDTGVRQVVFVDLGGGSFAPREVRLGARTHGSVQVAQGLSEGEKVATRGTFLLDSESRIRATVSDAAEASPGSPP
jgi:membrane fusion protein, copper/silver efflux system